MPQMEVGEARVQLHSGDLLVLTTDGIHEARDAQGNEYGIKRLSRRIRSARGGPDDVVKAILQDVNSHVASGSQGDDITIVAMGVGAKRARRRTDTIPGVAPGDPLPPEPEGESGGEAGGEGRGEAGNQGQSDDRGGDPPSREVRAPSVAESGEPGPGDGEPS